MTFWEIFFYSLIEGLTEFLPVSSTGHLIIFSHYLAKENEAFTKSFEVIIQFGAIFSVIVVYWKTFFSSLQFYKNLFVAFLPAAVIGFLMRDLVTEWLGSIAIVAWALIIGGIVLILSDFYFKSSATEGKGLEKLNYKESLYLGLFQCLALIPGVSRSGATILGGLALKYNKKAAAEFSFFLAVPTIAAATLYKSYKIVPTITSDQVSSLLLGCFLSFVIAIVAITTFIKLVSRYGFKHFGIYRIALGSLILILSQ
ncbi:MAG: undecaprenyl-diphosphatase UppP [Bdellovibrionaceae bacterium]|nr:undecaprenyl-diphosphatase UppP [Pseudobdellovibrionaceae bacterium]